MVASFSPGRRRSETSRLATQTASGPHARRLSHPPWLKVTRFSLPGVPFAAVLTRYRWPEDPAPGTPVKVKAVVASVVVVSNAGSASTISLPSAIQ